MFFINFRHMTCAQCDRHPRFVEVARDEMMQGWRVFAHCDHDGPVEQTIYVSQIALESLRAEVVGVRLFDRDAPNGFELITAPRRPWGHLAEFGRSVERGGFRRWSVPDSMPIEDLRQAIVGMDRAASGRPRSPDGTGAWALPEQAGQEEVAVAGTLDRVDDHIWRESDLVEADSVEDLRSYLGGAEDAPSWAKPLASRNRKLRNYRRS